MLKPESVTAVVEAFEELARSVGFEDSAVPEISPGIELPVGAVTWSSTYAIVLLLPIGESDSESMLATSEIGLAWMRDRLEEAEKLGILLDGYLLIAIAREPDEAESAVRDIETDPRICRKHVLWPTADGDWTARLARVSILGLPDPPEAAGPAIPAELPTAAIRALQFYETTNSLDRAAAAIENHISEIAENGGENVGG